jgi:hypothetical protein
MAEFIKFRLTAAKAGVTMALMALIAGLAENAHAAKTDDGSAHFLREISIPTCGGIDRMVIQKLDGALASLEHKLATSFETTHKLNQTFLKIKSANTEFLKIKSADTSFLKIDSASAQFLKIDSANDQFLKIDSANDQFLKIDGVAADSSELGGLASDAFVQGKGDVVSNFVPLTAANNVDNQAPLVSSPDGLIGVTVFDDSGTVTLVVKNNGSTDLPAVQDTDGQTTSRVFTAGEFSPLPISSTTAQTTLQILPAGSSADVITLTVSIDVTAGASTGVVAQMLVGSSS